VRIETHPTTNFNLWKFEVLLRTAQKTPHLAYGWLMLFVVTSTQNHTVWTFFNVGKVVRTVTTVLLPFRVEWFCMYQ
jgi:hypothetical protein